MKSLPSFLLALSGIASSCCLALGFASLAQKFDPVSSQATSISTMETGKLATLPCMLPSKGDTELI